MNRATRAILFAKEMYVSLLVYASSLTLDTSTEARFDDFTEGEKAFSKKKARLASQEHFCRSTRLASRRNGSCLSNSTAQ